MKKVIILGVSIFIFSKVFAYNPPVASNQLFKLSSPTSLSGGSSASGKAIFDSTPESIAVNPSLTAFEQRVQLDGAFSALISSDSDSTPFNAAFQTGILIPWKFGVFSGLVNGVFSNANEMNLGNSVNVKAGLSKEVTQRFSVGLNLSSGAFWGALSDWHLAADLGLLYRRENLGFLKDFRFGLSFLNLGKVYETDLEGINSDERADWFPSIVTVKAGVSSVFVQVKDFKFGSSLNVTVPTFQNGIFDLGLEFGIKDIVFVNVAETFDIQEFSRGHYDFCPSIGVSFKFLLNSKNNNYLKAHDWDKSEFTTSLAYQNKYSTMNVISGGLNIKLGQQDTKPPVIEIWN